MKKILLLILGITSTATATSHEYNAFINKSNFKIVSPWLNWVLNSYRFS